MPLKPISLPYKWYAVAGGSALALAVLLMVVFEVHAPNLGRRATNTPDESSTPVTLPPVSRPLDSETYPKTLPNRPLGPSIWSMLVTRGLVIGAASTASVSALIVVGGLIGRRRRRVR